MPRPDFAGSTAELCAAHAEAFPADVAGPAAALQHAPAASCVLEVQRIS